MVRPRTSFLRSTHQAGLALAWLLVLSCAAEARLMVPLDAAETTQEPVLADIAAAFMAGDHEVLADLMDPAGVQLEMSPAENRVTALTPAQAYYYFRNLFGSRRTLLFEFKKSQSSGDTRLHAMAIWRYERTDGGGAQAQRLLLTLAPAAGNWRVIEITTLRGD